MIVICYHGIDNKCQGVCDWVVGTLCLSNKLCELCEFFDLQFNAMVENLVGNFDEIFVEKIFCGYFWWEFLEDTGSGLHTELVISIMT